MSRLNGTSPSIPTVDIPDHLATQLTTRTATIGIVGLGYVGLPLAMAYAAEGYDVLGIDVSERIVDQLNRGVNHIEDVDDAELARRVDEEAFRAEATYASIGEADVVFVCVPTPVTQHKDPDTTYIEQATAAMARHLRPGQLLILKSTTYPDTTEGVVQPILEKAGAANGLTLGEDYFLAFSPERVDPGNKEYTTATTPVVVGGVTEACTDVAALALEQIVGTVHRVSSPKVAEMEKLLENIFRSVNIALVNELAQLCDRVGGIDIWEVVEAAETKPFGFMKFTPGPGIGGHCIPIDPYYLSWLARKYDFETSFITLAARINEEMPFYVADAVMRAVAHLPVALSDARVLLLGVSFKPNVADTRHSPAERVLQVLRKRGVTNVSYTDPHVPAYKVQVNGSAEELPRLPLTPEVLEQHDVAIVLTDHTAFDYEMIAAHAPMIVDTRNALRDIPCAEDKLVVLGSGSF
ncbi:MAG: nucleotide sugar dehydrogenase [Bacteroidetes bacterium]|jgi:UDP-N-acetyl-D-glucosamine dehydrogenase|nr:nucleotide sugar dehydrogenase [Bacteroidota bacterium]